MTVPRKKRAYRKKQAESLPPNLATESWTPLGIVFIVGLAMRLGHVLSIRSAPFIDLMIGDAASYDAWAREIVGGSWLGSEVFYQAPLYPYFLATVYGLLGDEILLVRYVQAFLGALACVLLAAATKRIFSRKEGLAAGMLMALYAPAIFFDGLMQKSSLDLFLLCLLIWLFAPLLASAPAPAEAKRLFALGVVLAMLTLNRENAIALALPLIVWIGTGSHREPKRRLRMSAVFAIGMVTVLLPVGIRNAVVGGELLLTTSQFGPNLYIGNNPEANGTYRPLRPRRGDAQYERDDAAELAEAASGRALSPSEVSDYFVARVLDFVRSEPLAWSRLMLRKLLLVWNSVEVVDTEDQYSVAAYSTLLALAGILFHFGALLPLAAIGLVLTRWERQRLWPLYAMAAIYAASVVTFYLFARYRLPLVPFLVIFAAAGLTGVLPFWRTAVRRDKLLVLAPALATLLLASLPLVEREKMQATTHYNWAGGLRMRGNVREAAAQYRRALELDPDFAMAHNNLGSLYWDEGNEERAFEHFGRAVALDESFEDARNNLGNLLVERGEPVLAERHLETAIRIRPDYPEAHNNLGSALSAQGRVSEARASYEKALELNPDYAHAHYNLGSLLLEERAMEGAERHFQRAVEIDGQNAKAWNNLGMVQAVRGDLSEAAESFRRALTIDPGYEGARINLTRAEASQRVSP